MSIMKNLVKVIAAIFVVVSLCIACGGKDASNTSSKESNVNKAKELGWDNPFNITDISPIYNTSKDGDDVYYSLERIKIQTSDGELMYDDGQMEDVLLYMHYFFMSYMIASGGTEYAPYLKDHLLEVVHNLPLDQSYPDGLREYANYVYYNYKDKLKRMIEYEKGNGYVEYAYDQGAPLWDEPDVYCFRLYRDENTGRVMLDRTIRDFDPRKAN